MEFQFNFENILPGTFNRVSGPSFEVDCWDEDGNYVKKFRPHVGWLSYMKEVLDTAGKASAKAQGLPSAITTFEKVQNFEHTVYIVTKKGEKRNQNYLLGFIKVGRKKLFLLDAEGFQNEVTPVCVLDFYVPEAVQRRGHGKTLFEFMLKVENVEPYHLAIDRPSEMFLGLLNKHFGLNMMIPQVINYVIFAKFFEGRDDHVEKKTKDRLFQDSSPLVGRKAQPPAPPAATAAQVVPGGIVYLATAAKQKSTLAQERFLMPW